MANTCFSGVTVMGPPKQIKALTAELKAAAAIRTYAENWLGNLWLHMGHGLDEAMGEKLGRCAGEIDGIHEINASTVCLDVSSKWTPHLKPVAEFVRKYAPDAAVEYAASEPLMDIHWTSRQDDIYVGMDVGCDLPPEHAFLETWPTLFPQRELVAAMSERLGVHGGFDELKPAFEAAYPVEFHVFSYVPLEDVCP